jgi:enoyl-CoA hydratase
MNMNYQTLTIKKDGQHILIVTLNRPAARNAINSIMMVELRDLWQELCVNVDKIRCVILTGAAPSFCAGADLKERNSLDLTTWHAQHIIFEQAMRAMLDCTIPIIAAVNGAAFGGGLELMLASDFAYAATNATFAQSEAKIGIMPGALGTQNLPRAAGLRRAKELTYTAESFFALQAFEWGIINKVCEPDELFSDVLQTAHKIANNAPLAVQQAKKSLNMSQHMDLKSGFSYEIEAYNFLLSTKDRVEGIQAFNEKRKAEFIGE